MRIDTQEERPIDLVVLPIQADSLRDGQDVPFVEGVLEG
jgi:hypothetical protein